MTDIRKWYGNGGRFVSWRMVYAPDDLETGPRQCQHGRHGRRGDPDLPPDRAGEAMRTAWRYVTDHKPAPQGRE